MLESIADDVGRVLARNEERLGDASREDLARLHRRLSGHAAEGGRRAAIAAPGFHKRRTASARRRRVVARALAGRRARQPTGLADVRAAVPKKVD